mgnify:CR=1 FL=1
MRQSLRVNQYIFQSTLSMRRATVRVPVELRVGEQISIHALHEESDYFTGVLPGQGLIFQSTLSMRRATPLGGIAY